MPIAKLVRKRLDELLVEEGLLKDDQVVEIHRHMRATGEGFIELLVKLGLATDMDVARCVVKQSGLPYIDASRYRVDRDVLKGIPGDFMWQNQLIVLDKIGKTVLVAVSGVPNPEVYEKLEKATGSQIFLYVTTCQQAREALEKHAPQPKTAAVKPAVAGVPAKPAAPAAARTSNPPSGTVVKAAVSSAGGTAAARPGEKK